MTAARTAQRVLLVGLLVIGGISVAGIVSADQPSITNVTVSPQEPRPGELVRFTTTIQNAQGASGSFEVTDIWIRGVDSSTEYARVENPGNVPPGASLQVPLTTRFDSTGV